ncbi:Neuropeptide F receptor, partial [Fragariocoptes setiger]
NTRRCVKETTATTTTMRPSNVSTTLLASDLVQVRHYSNLGNERMVRYNHDVIRLIAIQHAARCCRASSSRLIVAFVIITITANVMASIIGSQASRLPSTHIANYVGQQQQQHHLVHRRQVPVRFNTSANTSVRRHLALTNGTILSDPNNVTSSKTNNDTQDRTSMIQIMNQYVNNRAIDTPTFNALLAGYTILIVIGVAGNGLVCLTVARKPKKMLSARNIFIVNLAISDLLLCVFTMPFSFIEISTKIWPMGKLTCKLVAGLQATSIYVSTISITAIALDRYKVIVYPTQDSRRRLSIFLTLCLIWSCALGLSMPLFYFRTIDHIKIGLPGLHAIDYCLERWPVSHGRLIYSLFSMMFQYVMPIVIVSLVNARISKKLHYRMVRKSQQYQLACNRRHQKRLVKKTNTMLIAISLIFGLSWLPLNLINLLADVYYPFTDDQQFKVTFAICHAMACSSACSNPILYGFLNDNFRKEFNEIFTSYCNCCWRFCYRSQPLPSAVTHSTLGARTHTQTSADNHDHFTMNLGRKNGSTDHMKQRCFTDPSSVVNGTINVSENEKIEHSNHICSLHQSDLLPEDLSEAKTAVETTTNHAEQSNFRERLNSLFSLKRSDSSARCCKCHRRQHISSLSNNRDSRENTKTPLKNIKRRFTIQLVANTLGGAADSIVQAFLSPTMPMVASTISHHSNNQSEPIQFGKLPANNRCGAKNCKHDRAADSALEKANKNSRKSSEKRRSRCVSLPVINEAIVENSDGPYHGHTCKDTSGRPTGEQSLVLTCPQTSSATRSTSFIGGTYIYTSDSLRVNEEYNSESSDDNCDDDDANNNDNSDEDQNHTSESQSERWVSVGTNDTNSKSIIYTVCSCCCCCCSPTSSHHLVESNPVDRNHSKNEESVASKSVPAIKSQRQSPVALNTQQQQQQCNDQVLSKSVDEKQHSIDHSLEKSLKVNLKEDIDENVTPLKSCGHSCQDNKHRDIYNDKVSDVTNSSCHSESCDRSQSLKDKKFCCCSQSHMQESPSCLIKSTDIEKSGIKSCHYSDTCLDCSAPSRERVPRKRTCVDSDKSHQQLKQDQLSDSKQTTLSVSSISVSASASASASSSQLSPSSSSASSTSTSSSSSSSASSSVAANSYSVSRSAEASPSTPISPSCSISAETVTPSQSVVSTRASSVGQKLSSRVQQNG